MRAEELVDKYWPVLDKGFVALKGVMGNDETIEQYARVSYGKGTRKQSDIRNLIRYLIRNHHSTPVEAVEFSFHLSLPIHVARQLVRHRTFSPINEYSARYSVVPELYYEISSEQFCSQSKNNKQGRSDQIDSEYYEEFEKETKELQDRSFALYQKALDNGVAREIARMHLPLNTYTYWYCKMDLNNLFKMLKLRLDSHAQWEIRQYATAMASIVREIVPIAWEAFEDYVLNARTFTRLDLELLDSIKHDGPYYSDAHEDTERFNIAEHIGMSKREYEEFKEKLNPSRIDVPKLNLADAKPPEYFEELLNK